MVTDLGRAKSVFAGAVMCMSNEASVMKSDVSVYLRARQIMLTQR